MQTWPASLHLDFRRDRGGTTLARRHSGPLQVQKALYPEGRDLCHAIVIHPPGGIAGGDALSIDVAAAAGAQALITTPGATKWYKANGRRASQQVRLQVQGTLEWLPQESIVFDEAVVDAQIEIDVAQSAAMIGWDIVVLGRIAAGERFDKGRFRQSIRLRDDERLQWVERTCIDGGDALLDSPIGLAAHRVFGCLWAIGPHWTDAQIEALRARLPSGPDAAVITRLAPRLLLARALGASSAAVRAAFENLWRELRPLMLARQASAPRIWAT